MTAQNEPAEEYQRRLEDRRAESARWARRQLRISNLRLIAVVLFVGLAWASLGAGVVSPLWLLAPVVVFGGLVSHHDEIRRLQARAGRAAAAYERGLARIEDRWIGTGETGDRFRDTHHPYEEDLDLFGRGSLFELLSIARTRMGEDRLARWLLAPAGLQEVRDRQQAVEDLRMRLDLREDLGVLGEDVRVGVHPEALISWAAERPILKSAGVRVAAATLAILAALTAGIWAWTGFLTPLLLVLSLEISLGYWLRSRVQHVVQGVEFAAGDLALLSQVLARLEREPFSAPRLARLRDTLHSGGSPPSQQIARLNRLVELLDSRDNWFLRILGPPLLYTTQLAFAVEAWRIRNGPQVRRWVDAAGELEALVSLAGYSYEHPADPFPELVEAGPRFEGEELGHPLLPASRCVRNDVRLGDDVRVMIVSGSNMSGKSSLLRTVGVNTVLAMAGAPVRARRLRLSPLTVGASIRVMDSLQAGSSRFYAEITRLKKMVDMAGSHPPLLFLLDELLHGTNSHDRRIGAEAIILGLIGRGAIGLVTTHDLALSRIVETLGVAGTNVHFEDHLENGRMTFDYRLRPGVVAKSNALELMRSIGLEV